MSFAAMDIPSHLSFRAAFCLDTGSRQAAPWTFGSIRTVNARGVAGRQRRQPAHSGAQPSEARQLVCVIVVSLLDKTPQLP